MVRAKRLLIIYLSIFIILAAPMAGAFIYFKGQLASHFFSFPPTEATPKPGFNTTVFIVLLVFCLFFVVLYIYPWIFGFKRPKIKKPDSKKAKLPIWFWIGLSISILDAIILWGHFSKPGVVAKIGFIPLIWGLVFTVDGIVYRRSQGHSLFSDKKINLIFIGICSAIGWGYFEYLSLFVGVNWFYPMAKLITTFEFYIYAFIGGAALVPFVFEIFMLLNTFEGLKSRYSFGPKISLSRTTQLVILLISIASMFAISYFPFILYPLLWIGPVVILSIIFDMIGLWTPFRPVVEKGNWTPLALIGLADLTQGLICEGTNFLSASHHPFHTMVPGYWKYSIPYVDKFHVFEMPFEGLFGYLPYGIYNWIVWIGFAYIFKISTHFDKKKIYNGVI